MRSNSAKGIRQKNIKREHNRLLVLIVVCLEIVHVFHYKENEILCKCLTTFVDDMGVVIFEENSCD